VCNDILEIDGSTFPVVRKRPCLGYAADDRKEIFEWLQAANRSFHATIAALLHVGVLNRNRLLTEALAPSFALDLFLALNTLKMSRQWTRYCQ
jgi:hypothetical protein